MSEESTANADTINQSGAVAPLDPTVVPVTEPEQSVTAPPAAPEAVPVEAAPEAVPLETSEPVAPEAAAEPQPSAGLDPEAASAPGGAVEYSPVSLNESPSEPKEAPAEQETESQPSVVTVTPPISESPQSPSAPEVREAQPRSSASEADTTGVIVEKEKELTNADKEAIFEERLKGHLTSAQRAKRGNYEKHLQEILAFIRARGTLVTNQDIEEGLHIPDSTVTDRLNVLVRRGLVVRLGDQRHAKYKLMGAL